LDELTFRPPLSDLTDWISRHSVSHFLVLQRLVIYIVFTLRTPIVIAVVGGGTMKQWFCQVFLWEKLLCCRKTGVKAEHPGPSCRAALHHNKG
jgi:hypothetical protein